MGTAIGAVIFASVISMGCAPGELPCTKDNDWKAICASDGGGGVTNTGGSGSGSGGSSGSGGTTGSGGSGGGMDAGIGARVVANCPDNMKTVADFEANFFGMKCEGGACHNMAVPFGDLKSANVRDRILDKTATLSCGGKAKWIDKADWNKSLIVLKSSGGDMPKCPDGSTAGLRMPSPPKSALTDDELKCLKSYAETITKP